MQPAQRDERGFSFGGTYRPAHRPDGLRPQGVEQAANQRRSSRRPESKFLSPKRRRPVAASAYLVLGVSLLLIWTALKKEEHA